MAPGPLSYTDSGFTLIELIMVIVLLGILGAMGADFINQAFKGFAASDRRLEIYEEGELALARMERELHIAVPNAVDVPSPGDSITFGVIDENKMVNVFGQYKDDPTGGKKIKDWTAGLQVGTLVSIYNTSWSGFTNGTRIYSVAVQDGDKMTMDRNIVATSPNKRFFAVRNQAVRFRVDAATRTLYRATAAVNAGDSLGTFDSPGQVLAKGIRQANNSAGTPLPFFTYSPGTLTRNAVVSVAFTLARDGEEVAFHKEIQVRNVP